MWIDSPNLTGKMTDFDAATQRSDGGSSYLALGAAQLIETPREPYRRGLALLVPPRAVSLFRRWRWLGLLLLVPLTHLADEIYKVEALRWWNQQALPVLRMRVVTLEAWSLTLWGAATVVLLAGTIYVATLAVKRGALNEEFRIQIEEKEIVLRNQDQEIGKLAQVQRHNGDLAQHMTEKLLTAHSDRKTLAEAFIDPFPSLPESQHIKWWKALVQEALLKLCDNYADAGAHHASVLLPTNSAHQLRVSIGSRVQWESLLHRRLSLDPDSPPQDKGVAGHVYLDRIPRYVPNVSQTEYHCPLQGRNPAYRSLLQIPVGHETPPLGVLSLDLNGELINSRMDLAILEPTAGLLSQGLRLLKQSGVDNDQLFEDSP